MLRSVVPVLCAVFMVTQAVAGSEVPSQSFETPRSTVHSVESDSHGRVYQVYVRTPPGYDTQQNRNKRYPVIYLNDGPYTFQVASGVTHLHMLSEYYEDVIIVGISFAEGENAMASRTRDLTPSRWAGWTARTGHETGGAGDYLAFLDTQLMPFVETEYRVDRERRTLAGHSFGGLFAAWVLLNKPELFRNYIISSPSLWFDQKMMFEVEEDYAAKHQTLEAVVYFGAGDRECGRECGNRNDLVGDQIAFVEKLRSRGHRGLVVRDSVLEEIDHLTAFPINFTRAYRWMFHSLWDER